MTAASMFKLPPAARRFAVALSSLTGPSILGAVVSFASTPLLVTWFSPAQFGETGNALAIASILAGLATLRLDMILYRPEHAARRAELARDGLVVSMVIAAVLLALLGPVDWIVRGSTAGDAARHALLVGLLTASLAVANIGSAFMVSESLFLRSGVPKLVTPIVILTVSAVAVLTGKVGAQTFLIANVIGSVAAALIYAREPSRRAHGKISGGMVPFLVGQRRFIGYAVAQSVVGAASFLNLFMVIVTSCYGAAAAGQLFLAYRILGFPSTVLGTAAGSLLSANVARMHGRTLQSYMAGMIGFGIALYAPLLMIALFVPEGIVAERWRGAVAVAVPMVLLCFAQFAIGSFGQLLLVWDQAHRFLWWDVARLTMTSGAAWLCWVAGGTYVQATWLFVALHSLMYVVLAVVIVTGSRHVQRSVEIAA